VEAGKHTHTQFQLRISDINIYIHTLVPEGWKDGLPAQPEKGLFLALVVGNLLAILA
jgi:hypothetical protein